MADLTTTRARRATTVDVASFEQDVRAALVAFASDVSYAVSIARAAVAITTKRRVWEARKKLRAAEAAAHAECANHDFHCHAQAPCGVGDCKFAQGQLSQLQTVASAGTTPRPQLHDGGAYSIESAVQVLLHQQLEAHRGHPDPV